MRHPSIQEQLANAHADLARVNGDVHSMDVTDPGQLADLTRRAHLLAIEWHRLAHVSGEDWPDEIGTIVTRLHNEAVRRLTQIAHRRTSMIARTSAVVTAAAFVVLIAALAVIVLGAAQKVAA